MRILDVGAGDGYVARTLLPRLAPGSEIVCLDLHYSDAHLAANRADAPAKLSFARERPPAPFDLVLLLDVVEHVPDDVALVRDLANEALRPGGHVLISVPTWMALFTAHDRMLGHYRRYRPRELTALIRACGFQREASGSLFHSLIVPRAAAKAAELLRGVRSRPDPTAIATEAETGLGRWRAGGLVTGAVNAALALDVAVSRAAARAGIPLPGLSAWVVAAKASTERTA